MKLRDIQDRVEAIKAISVDDEAAHNEEDALREDFIRYVAQTAAPSLAEKARLVLSTNDIKFNRWCA
jgi:hypothetical protein